MVTIVVSDSPRQSLQGSHIYRQCTYRKRAQHIPFLFCRRRIYIWKPKPFSVSATAEGANMNQGMAPVKTNNKNSSTQTQRCAIFTGTVWAPD